MFSFFKNKKAQTLKELPSFWKDYAAQFSQTEPINEHSDFVVLDTETTGFNYNTDRILCIGALHLKDSKIHINSSFEVFVHQSHYNAESAAIHGILKNEPIVKLSEYEALKAFLSYVGNSVLVAHHTKFDLTMINKALERHGLPPLKNKSLDTVFLYKKSLLRSPLIERKEDYSLDELADKFNISKKDRHTALGDAYITALLFLKILKKMKEKSGPLVFKRFF